MIAIFSAYRLMPECEGTSAMITDREQVLGRVRVPVANHHIGLDKTKAFGEAIAAAYPALRFVIEVTTPSAKISGFDEAQDHASWGQEDWT
jgi:hypothetical protein